MTKKIRLRAHDGSKNYLVFSRVKDKLYIFRLVTELPYYRFTYDKGMQHKIAVDPIGGPYMAVGSKTIIPGMVLQKIEFVENVGVELSFKSIPNATVSSKRYQEVVTGSIR